MKAFGSCLISRYTPIIFLQTGLNCCQVRKVDSVRTTLHRFVDVSKPFPAVDTTADVNHGLAFALSITPQCASKNKIGVQNCVFQ